MTEVTWQSALAANQVDEILQHSIRINAQWRVCFAWHDDGAYRVEIVDGIRPISADTALWLGLFFSMDPRYWLNLQTEYDMRTVMRTSHDKVAPRIRVFQPAAANPA